MIFSFQQPYNVIILIIENPEGFTICNLRFTIYMNCEIKALKEFTICNLHLTI